MAAALSTTGTISKAAHFIPVCTHSLNGSSQKNLRSIVRSQRAAKRHGAEASLGSRREDTRPDSSLKNIRVAYGSLLSSLLATSPVRAEELEEVVASTQEIVSSTQETITGAVEGAVDFAESAVEGAADLAGDLAGAVAGAADLAGDLAGAAAAGANEFAAEAIEVAQDAVYAAGVSPELVAGAAVVGIPVVLFSLFRKGYAGDVSAKDAFNVLLDEKTAVLLDVREKVDIDEFGGPKVPGKRPVTIPIEKVEDDLLVEDPEFASKVSAVKSLSDVAVAVYVIDRFGPTAVKAAKVLTKAGYKKVFAIIDGVEGPRGWKESGLAWKEPFRPFKLDLSAIKEAITSASAITEENSTLVPTTIGATAAVGLSILAFSEVETALQLLGSAALVQVFLKKFLFAEDRKQTIAELQTFLDTKVAPASLVQEFKEIGSVLTADPDTMSAKPKPKAAEAVAPLNGAVETKAVEKPKEATNGSASAATPVNPPPTPPTPVQAPEAESALAESAPAESPPAESAPAESAPAESAPAESAPAESASAESAPAVEASSTESPPVPVAAVSPSTAPPASPTPAEPATAPRT